MPSDIRMRYSTDSTRRAARGHRAASGTPSLRRATLAVATIVLNGCASNPILPADPGRAGDGSLNAALESVRASHDLPALAAVAVHSGTVLEAGAVGVRVWGGAERVAATDLWHVGSITKSMTATLAARLVERGVVAWTTTIAEALPELTAGMRPEYRDVPLSELLTHTSGLPNRVNEVAIWRTLRFEVGPETMGERREWARQLLAQAPENARGRYHYSNGGYIVAGAMFEAITGTSWESLMQAEVFDPLGITTAGFGPPGSAARDQPWGHTPEDGGWRSWRPGPGADNPAALGPAGTVHMSLADLAAYALAHLAGEKGGTELLTAESFETLHTARENNYAFGWNVLTQSWTGGPSLEHVGSNNRWFARVWLAPGRDFGFFTITNAVGTRAEQGTNAAALLMIERFDRAQGR